MRRNETTKGGLTRRQLRAIEALLETSTIEGAAKAAGVSKSTLFRWLQESDFANAYREAQSRVIEDAVAKLQRHSARAAEVLAEIMEDKATLVFARLSAARAILEFALRAKELEIDERLAAVEQFMEGRKTWH